MRKNFSEKSGVRDRRMGGRERKKWGGEEKRRRKRLSFLYSIEKPGMAKR